MAKTSAQHANFWQRGSFICAQTKVSGPLKF